MRNTRNAFSRFRPSLLATFRFLAESRVCCGQTALRHASSTSVPHEARIQFCVVGSGPAGFYTCDQVRTLAVCHTLCPTLPISPFSSRCLLPDSKEVSACSSRLIGQIADPLRLGAKRRRAGPPGNKGTATVMSRTGNHAMVTVAT